MDKLPEVYTEVVRLLKENDCLSAMKNDDDIKSIIDSQSSLKSNDRLYRRLNYIYHRKAHLKKIIAESGIHTEHPTFCPFLAYVLTTVLLTEGSPSGVHKDFQIFRKYQEKMLESAKRNRIHITKIYPQPMFVQVNTAMKDMEFFHSKFKEDGYILKEYDDNASYESFLELVKNLGAPYYLIDYHFKDKLVFPRGHELAFHTWDQQKMVNARKKLDCIRAQLCGVGENDKVIINNTSKGFSIVLEVMKKMKNTGTVLYFEKRQSSRRVLDLFLESNKAGSITYSERDFLDTDPSDYKDIEYVFLEAASNQSGMKPNNEVSRDDVQLQISSLNHALSFPNVKEVIYSTNSIDERENEQVVKQALLKYENEFNLADLSTKFKDWKNFGLPSYGFGAKCLRLDPSTDFFHGAFLAKFVRYKESSSAITPKKRKANENPSPAKKVKKSVKSNGTESSANGTVSSAKKKKKKTDKSNGTESSAKKKKTTDKSNKTESSAKKTDKSNGTESSAKKKKTDKSNNTESFVKKKKKNNQLN